MEWSGMKWNGMEWNGMEWNGVLISLERLYEQIKCCWHTSLSSIMMSQSENGTSLTRDPQTHPLVLGD